jgi:hypothetical protein
MIFEAELRLALSVLIRTNTLGSEVAGGRVITLPGSRGSVCSSDSRGRERVSSPRLTFHTLRGFFGAAHVGGGVGEGAAL